MVRLPLGRGGQALHTLEFYLGRAVFHEILWTSRNRGAQPPLRVGRCAFREGGRQVEVGRANPMSFRLLCRSFRRSRFASCITLSGGTKINSASLSTNFLINHGQATRSTLTRSRVIHFIEHLRVAGLCVWTSDAPAMLSCRKQLPATKLQLRSRARVI